MVPYIYEDHINNNTVANAFMQMFEFGPEKRAELGKKAREYAISEYSMEKITTLWDQTLEKVVNDFNSAKNKPKWDVTTF